MKHDVMVYNTKLPPELCNLFVQQASTFSLDNAPIGRPNEVHEKVRKSDIKWIGQENWICGFLWNYIKLANETNFGYDLLGFDNQHVQYTEYGPGGHYSWHVDRMNNEPDVVRKLSLTLQLSRFGEEYTGGELQFFDDTVNNTFTAPTDYGVITIFDSRIRHRVKKVKTGTRKSLVAWAVGPRWK